MISVALCTYNGEKHLLQQLESIVNQTVAVDELVICDDGSRDDTLPMLRRFAESAPFEVRIFQNETNLGSTRNFEKCLTLCRGEVLFCCDQDDVWRSDKVALQVAYLREHPAIDAVFSDAITIDEDSRPIGSTIWEEVQFLPLHRQKWKSGYAYKILFDGFVVTGATLALRRSCLDALMPFPTHVPRLIHDAWIALVLSLHDKIDFIDEPLISYRLHSAQQVGFGAKADAIRMRDRFRRDRSMKLIPIREKAEEAGQIKELLNHLPGVPPDRITRLSLRHQHFRQRATLPANRLLRFAPVVRELLSGRYRFSSEHWWLPVLGDLFE